MTINAPAAVLVAMYMAVARSKACRPATSWHGAERRAQGVRRARNLHFSAAPVAAPRGGSDHVLLSDAPKFNSISVSGYHIRDAGATAAQEIGFAFANAIAYIDACQRSGVEHRRVRARISWIFNTHNNFFEEIAKYRALRRMWAKLLRERFGATDPNSWKLRTHVQTGGATLTAQQPENNIVRASLQAMASVLGGVQSWRCPATTRRLPFRPKRRSASRCVRSRSSRTRPASPTRSIRSAAPTTSRA